MAEDNKTLVRREKLRILLDKSKELAKCTEPDSDQLQKIKTLWKDQNDLINSFDQLTMQEVLMDLELLGTTGSCLSQFVRNLRVNSKKFNHIEFGDKLVKMYGENGQMDWIALANDALPIINRAPGLNILLGTFQQKEPFVMPERKKRQTRVKDVVAQKQHAEKMHVVDKDKNEINARVKFLISELRHCHKKNKDQPISFYEFIIHPTSFTITVENIFYVAFLIRDGLAALEVKGDELYISPLEAQNDNAETSKKVTKHQMVMSITLEEWNEIVKERRIQKPAIQWDKQK